MYARTATLQDCAQLLVIGGMMIEALLVLLFPVAVAVALKAVVAGGKPVTPEIML